MTKRIKNIRVSLWMTLQDKNLLIEKTREAGFSSASELIRVAILHSEIKPRDDRYDRLLYEAHKTGVCVNQIAAHCNRTKVIDISVLKQLTIIAEALNRLL